MEHFFSGNQKYNTNFQENVIINATENKNWSKQNITNSIALNNAWFDCEKTNQGNVMSSKPSDNIIEKRNSLKDFRSITFKIKQQSSSEEVIVRNVIPVSAKRNKNLKIRKKTILLVGKPGITIVENLSPETVDNIMEHNQVRHVALFCNTLNGGGAERMMVNLANGFVKRGIKVDFLLGKAEGPYLKLVRPDIQIINLNSRKIRYAFRPLMKYLATEKPQILLSTQTHVSLTALLAKKLSFSNTKLLFREASLPKFRRTSGE